MIIGKHAMMVRQNNNNNGASLLCINVFIYTRTSKTDTRWHAKTIAFSMLMEIHSTVVIVETVTTIANETRHVHKTLMSKHISDMSMLKLETRKLSLSSNYDKFSLISKMLHL
jgi:hypothetical protein